LHHHLDGDLIGLYELVDDKGRCAGEVWMTGREAHESRQKPQNFVLLSYGIGFEKAEIARVYVPRRNEQRGGEGFPMQIGDQTVVIPSSTTVTVDVKPCDWVVGNVMLVEIDRKIVRRVALGKVINTALADACWRHRWVYLA